MNKLDFLPCPECGGKPIFVQSVGVAFMECENNDFRGGKVLLKNQGQDNDEIFREMAKRWNEKIEEAKASVQK